MLRVAYSLIKFYDRQQYFQLLLMEARPRGFSLSDDQKQVLSNDHLQHTLNNSQLREVGELVQEMNGQTDIQVKYYLEFKKIYYTSFKLSSEIRKQTKIKEAAAHRIAQIEMQLVALHKTKRQEDLEEEPEECDNDSKRKGSKRTRRTAEEIERRYYCSAEYCDRCYGSQGSLQQHIKLKHPQLYKKQNDSSEF